MTVTYKMITGRKERCITVLCALIFAVCMIGLSVTDSHARRQTALAIDYLASSRSHTATMQIDEKAEDVWQSVVDIAKKRNPDNLKITEEDRADLEFEATKKTKSGETLWASIKVNPLVELPSPAR